MRREFVCILCPKSCELTTIESGGALSVEGNQCRRGLAFAEQETYDPQRVLTTTVKLTTGRLLPVRSKGTVRKGDLKALVEWLRSVTVAPPVRIGRIVAESNIGNRVEIIATDDAE